MICILYLDLDISYYGNMLIEKGATKCFAIWILEKMGHHYLSIDKGADMMAVMINHIIQKQGYQVQLTSL